MTSDVTDSGVEKVNTSHGDWFSLQSYTVRSMPDFNGEAVDTREEVFAVLRILMVQFTVDKIYISGNGLMITRKLLEKMRKAGLF